MTNNDWGRDYPGINFGRDYPDPNYGRDLTVRNNFGRDFGGTNFGMASGDDTPVVPPVPFIPSSLTGLALWIDASDIAQADSTAIASMTERSGSGAVIAQATGANQPTFRTSPARISGGASKFLGITSLPSISSGAFTLFIVAKPTSTATQHMLGLADSGKSTAQISDGYWEASQGGSFIISASTGLTVTTSAWQVMTLRGDTSNATLPQIAARLDGQHTMRQQTKNGSNWAATSTTSAYLGAFGTGVAGSGFLGDIQAVLLYSRALTTGEIAQVEAYLASRYTVTLLAAPTRNVVLDGNSLTVGATVPVGISDRVIDTLDNSYRISNVAVLGQRIATMNTNYSAKIAPLYDAAYALNILTCWEGTNALTQGQTPAQVYASTVAYCQAARATGWKIAVGTVLPAGGTTPAGFEADRIALNTLLRANALTDWDYLMDIGDDPLIGQPGDELSATYYDSGHIHMTSAGYAVVTPYFLDAIDFFVNPPVPGTAWTVGTSTVGGTDTIS